MGAGVIFTWSMFLYNLMVIKPKSHSGWFWGGCGTQKQIKNILSFSATVSLLYKFIFSHMVPEINNRLIVMHCQPACLFTQTIFNNLCLINTTLSITAVVIHPWGHTYAPFPVQCVGVSQRRPIKKNHWIFLSLLYQAKYNLYVFHVCTCVQYPLTHLGYTTQQHNYRSIVPAGWNK